MTQLLRSEPPEPDPLLAFEEEAREPSEPPEPAKPSKPEPSEPAEPSAPAEPSEPAELLKSPDPPEPLELIRLDRVERQVDRALIDLTSLRSDLATLVSAVDDIKKRAGRPQAAARAVRPALAAVVALPRRPRPGPRAIAGIAMLLIAGAAVWGLVSVATSDLPGPIPVERVAFRIVGLRPVVHPDPPEVSSSANVFPSRTPYYVGTLTVDAEPGGDVYLDRKRVGRTPLRLENLRAGSHLIWIQRDGYRRFTRVVPVAANRISRVTASLDPISR